MSRSVRDKDEPKTSQLRFLRAVAGGAAETDAPLNDQQEPTLALLLLDAPGAAVLAGW
jgi:hypothetical protein